MSIDKKIIAYLVDIPRTVSVISASKYLFPAVAQVVEALRYRPKDHGFDSPWRQWNFSFK